MKEIESLYELEVQLVLQLIWCDVAGEDMPACINWKSAKCDTKTVGLKRVEDK